MVKRKCKCKKRGRKRKVGRPKGSKNKKGRKKTASKMDKNKERFPYRTLSKREKNTC